MLERATTDLVVTGITPRDLRLTKPAAGVTREQVQAKTGVKLV